MNKTSVMIVINSISLGGAEKTVIDFINNDNEFFITLVVLESSTSNNLFSAKERNDLQIINLNTRRKISVQTFRNLHSIIKSVKPDIVHAHLFPSFYYVAAIKIFSKLTFYSITTEHGIANNRRKLLFYPIEKKIYDSFDLVICVSNTVKISLVEWLKTKNKRKFEVIFNGIDFKEVSNSRTDYLDTQFNLIGKIKLLSVGRLVEVKRLDTLIKVMRLLPDNYVAIIYGDGPYKKTLINLVKKIGVEDKVYFAGFSHDLSYPYSSADMLIHTSLSEGFGMSVLEALAWNIPVIASNIETLNELFGNCIVNFHPGNVNDLFEKIIELNNEDYKIKTTECRQQLKIYSSDNSFNLIAKQYKKATGKAAKNIKG